MLHRIIANLMAFILKWSFINSKSNLYRIDTISNSAISMQKWVAPTITKVTLNQSETSITLLSLIITELVIISAASVIIGNVIQIRRLLPIMTPKTKITIPATKPETQRGTAVSSNFPRLRIIEPHIMQYNAKMAQRIRTVGIRDRNVNRIRILQKTE
nr:hypothetical transcript [Hymenolepis microstoma]